MCVCVCVCVCVSHPVKALGLEEVSVDTVELPPSSGAAAVDRLWGQRKRERESQEGCLSLPSKADE